MKKLICILIMCFAFTSLAQNAAAKAELFIQGFDVIWGMAQISADEILFTTRNGTFNILNLKNKSSVAIKSTLKVFNSGQGGLLDIELHPDFKNNNKVYFTYSCEKEKLNTTCLGTAILDKKNSTLNSLSEIFFALPLIESKMHFGSRLAWDLKNNLYMSVGERYVVKDEAQSLASHLGKILRLDENGKAAKGNPFTQNLKAKSEIFSYGHRNPQGLFFDKETKTLWEHEHGAKGGDEINLIEAGKNYGWPVITHGVDYDGDKIGIGKEKEGMEQPKYTYTPSIAPSGLLIYSGKKYKNLKGAFFLGALVKQHINQVQYANGKFSNETKLLTELNERIRDIIETDIGDIYFSTDSGKIFRLNLK